MVANSRKFQVLAILKDCIAQARKESSSTTKSKATIFREALREAYAENNSSAIEAIEFLAVDEAEIIERQHGLSVAQAFHDEATAVAPTLAEAAEEWLSATLQKRVHDSSAAKPMRAFGHSWGNVSAYLVILSLILVHGCGRLSRSIHHARPCATSPATRRHDPDGLAGELGWDG